jgi:hypothetical protein
MYNCICTHKNDLSVGSYSATYLRMDILFHFTCHDVLSLFCLGLLVGWVKWKWLSLATCLFEQIVQLH